MARWFRVLWLRIRQFFRPRKQELAPRVGRTDPQLNYLTTETLAKAKKVQAETHQDLGKILIDLGFADEREVHLARAHEAGIGFVDLDQASIDTDAISSVPERIAKNHEVFPVKKEGSNLFLAMSNPNNIQALDDVRAVSGCRVIPVMAIPGAIDDAIRRYYGESDL